MIILDEILFLLFAFFTVFLSIKLSCYADILNKTSNVSGAFIGGIVLAGVTSLPELVTCFSSILVGNNSLALGDILGSNFFNIFMICFFDLVFIKKMIFSKTSKSHNLIFLLLIINYIVLFLFTDYFSSVSFLFLGVPTFFIFFTYAFYLFRISKSNVDDTVKINDSSCSNTLFKLIITAVFMIFSSVILTVVVNNIAVSHPSFSSSFLGAIFLGITTSLPEVVTCYTLISLNNYDLAVSDIIGSNFFNLLVLAFSDLVVKASSIYSFSDSGVVTLVGLGFIVTFLCFVSNNLRSNKFKGYYGILSFVIVIMYLGYWFVNFVR